VLGRDGDDGGGGKNQNAGDKTEQKFGNEFRFISPH